MSAPAGGRVLFCGDTDGQEVPNTYHRAQRRTSLPGGPPLRPLDLRPRGGIEPRFGVASIFVNLWAPNVRSAGARSSLTPQELSVESPPNHLPLAGPTASGPPIRRTPPGLRRW